MAMVIGAIARARIDAAGAGYIAGTVPHGLLTVADVPAMRAIILVVRAGCRIASSTWSAPDGTYQFDGVHPDIEFDLIARDWAGIYNDTIVSRVRPEPYDVTALTDETTAHSVSGELGGMIRVYGGEPGHTVAVTAGTAPPGLTFACDIAQDDQGAATFAVTASGTTSAGTYTWDLTVTAPVGSAQTITLTKTWA